MKDESDYIFLNIHLKKVYSKNILLQSTSVSILFVNLLSFQIFILKTIGIHSDLIGGTQQKITLQFVKIFSKYSTHS